MCECGAVAAAAAVAVVCGVAVKPMVAHNASALSMMEIIYIFICLFLMVEELKIRFSSVSVSPSWPLLCIFVRKYAQISA